MTDSEPANGIPSNADSKPVPVAETSTAEEAFMLQVVLEEKHRLKQARDDRLQTAHSFTGIGAALFVVAGIAVGLMLVSESTSFLVYGLAVWAVAIGAAFCCWGAVVKSRSAPVEERKLILLAEDMPGDGVAREGAAK